MNVAEWVQVIFTAALVLITAYYAYLTGRLVQESSNAFIKIDRVDIKDGQLSGCIIEVTNFGPGNALNIEIEIEMKSFEKIIEGDSILLKKAFGKNVLTVNEKGRYEINDVNLALPEEANIVISYKTITGRKYRHKWKFLLNERGLIFLGEDKTW